MYLLLLVPLFFRLSGSSALMGPQTVSGQEQDSLMVQCHYDQQWEKHVKYWCQGAVWSSCKILVQTIGSEWEETKNRVSIKDNQTSHMFTVTMEKLRLDDTDTYWCGIEKTGRDLGVKVKVTVSPERTTTSNATPTTINMFTASVMPEDTTGFRIGTSHLSDVNGSGGQRMKLSVLLPLIFAVLLLLLVAASLLAWRMVKRRKKAAEESPGQVSQSLESDLCYANLTLQQAGSTPISSWRKASPNSCSSTRKEQVEVEYVTMDSILKEDIAHAALFLDTVDQEPIYINMGDLITHLPSGSQEPTEYSAIRKA